jgi:hypothetical protein
MNANLGDFLEQLDLNDEALDDLVIDEDDPEMNECVRRLALARVHTDKTFSHLVKLLSTATCELPGIKCNMFGFVLLAPSC